MILIMRLAARIACFFGFYMGAFGVFYIVTGERHRFLGWECLALGVALLVGAWVVERVAVKGYL